MKKLDFLEAKKRFSEQRDDILLVEGGYISWKKNAKFFDLIIQEEFSAIPHNVYKQKSTHPHRAKEKRQKTNLDVYGNICSLHGKEQKEKTQKTWEEKYGTNPAKTEKVKAKIKDILLKKYGVENIGQLRKKTVSETGGLVEDWWKEQPDPKPSSYASFGTMYLFGKQQSSFSLQELESFLNSYRDYKNKLEIATELLLEVKHYNKAVNGYRPDFKISESLFVNCDGLFWHSIKQKSKDYHFLLRKKFEESNLSILQFREDEIFNKQDIVRSIVKNKLGQISDKFFARKSRVNYINQKEASLFLNRNHLMGSIRAKHLALLNNNGEIISLLSYKKFPGKNKVVVERFCSLINFVVPGAFGKLLKALEEAYPDMSIEYWVDLRYGTGKHLTNFGFDEIKDTLGWKWTDGKSTFNRRACRANMDDRKLSEKEHAEELGWYRIYDAGQRLFIKKK